MLSPALSALTAPATPAPHAAAPAPSHDEAPEASFANRLQQAREPHGTAAARNGASKPAAQKAENRPAKPSGKDTKAEERKEDDDKDQDDSTDAAGRDAAAALHPWLAGWHAAPAPAEGAAAGGHAATADANTEATTAQPADALQSATRRGPAAAAGKDAPADLRGAERGAAGKQDFGALLAASESASKGGQGGQPEGDAPGRQAPGAARDASALGGAAAFSGAAAQVDHAAPTAATPAATPFEAQLSAAMGSPDFAPALGVQVSVLLREGIQEARLHLNPAEMGPIAVQIALDGQNAQVHFQADHAATRDALQNSLPDLAAALQDSGFTLSGGGVSDSRGGASGQPATPDSNAGGAAAGSQGARGSDPAAPAAAPQRVLRRQGAVDLYA